MKKEEQEGLVNVKSFRNDGTKKPPIKICQAIIFNPLITWKHSFNLVMQE